MPESSSAVFSKPLAAQIYTVRDALEHGSPEEAQAAIQGIADIGYTEIEGVDGTWDIAAPLASAAGLKIVAMHVSSSKILGAGDRPAMSVSELADYAHGNNFPWVVMPSSPRDMRASLDGCKNLAAKLNEVGEGLNAAGLKFAYHNHSTDFAPVEGSSFMDALVAETDADFVKVEADVFWVSVAGYDPAQWIRDHADRVRLVHLKDKGADTPTQFTTDVPYESFKEVGAGVLDFPAILQACEEAGVEHYIVEQDRTTGNPVDSLRQSYAYLRTVEV